MDCYSIEKENEYTKLERSLKKYNMIAFKKLMFDYYPTIKSGKFIGEKTSNDKDNKKITYKLNLPTDSRFEKVNGKMQLIYTVDKENKVIKLNSIEPKGLLLEGRHSELLYYKGVLISKANADKDMFKINLLNLLNNKDDK